MQPSEPRRDESAGPWYRGVSGYQWLVLALASAGWVFDIYEGQIFNITRVPLLTELLAVSHDDSAVADYGDVLLGTFLAGTSTNLLQGALQQTGNNLNLAIEGNGYFTTRFARDKKRR